MTGLVAGMGVKAALGAAGAHLKQISPRTWLIIGCALAALLGALWAHHWYAGQIKAAEKRGFDAAYANVAKQAATLTAKANALNAKLAAQMRKETDAKLAAVHADAAAMRLRGSGAARCTAIAGVPIPSGRSQPSSGPGNAALDQVHSGEWPDLIALPIAPTIDFGEQHDAFRVEAIQWRGWYARFSAEWAKWNADAAKARTTP